MSPNKLLRKLSQNLLEILDDDEYYDTTIEVGKDPYVKIFRAHMVILNYRSSYMRRILSTNKKKNDEALIQIKLPNILPDIFQIVLRYIYGGILSLEDYDNLDIIKVLVVANELNLHDLIAHIQSYLIKNKTDWMGQNFNLIYQTSFENNSFLKLQLYCTNLMSKYPDKILKSLDFSSVSEKVLISLIQSDNLQMSEIQVWENVLKWGLTQNPGLSSDPSNYSKDDFNSLKNTLQSCIPFIRFYNLTSQEFSDHVLPYKEVLPEELYMDLLKTFLSLNPGSRPSHKSNPRKAKDITSPPHPRPSNSPRSNSPPPRPSNSPRSNSPPPRPSNSPPPRPLNTPPPRPSYSPPPRPSNSPPPRPSYSPPPRTSNTPPPRPSYSPPPRTSYSPPPTPPHRSSRYSPPPRPSYSPPPRSSYTLPLRPSYSPPRSSYTPPRPSYSPPLRSSHSSTDSFEITFESLNIVQPQPSTSRLSNYSEDLIDFSESNYQSDSSDLSTEISEEYQEKLAILESMGFHVNNREEILRVLKEFDGDLEAVVNNLL